MVDIAKKHIVKKCINVPAGDTIAIDSVAVSKFDYATYSLRYLSDDGLKARSLKLDVFLNDTDVKDQVYAKGGFPLDVAVCSTIVGSAVEVQVTNNESFDVEVCFLRLKL